MSSIKTILIPYKASTENSYIVEISYQSIRFYTQHGILEKDEEIYRINSPYKYGDLFDEKGISRINYVQNGDYLYLFHPLYPIRVLYRDKFNEWNLEVFELKSGPWQNVNTSSAILSVITHESGGDVLISNLDTFSEGDVGKLFRLTIVDSSTPAWEPKKEYKANDYVFSDNKYYRCVAGGTSGTIKPVHTKGARSDGELTWEYKHSGYGVVEVIEYTDPKTLGVVKRGEFPDDIKTQYWERSVFGGDCVYPMCGAFFKGRLAIMANTNNVPTVYMSCSDDFNNFADKDYGEVLDTNAITVQLFSSEYATPCFLVSADTLFAGTTAGEFNIDSPNNGNPLSPSNVYYRQFSTFGSLPVKPQKVGGSILYVSKQGVGLRNILYSFERDGYESLDISLFGKHLLGSGIKKIVYQELPDKIVWIITQDGKLIGLTFMAEQEVCAFSCHNLSDPVVDIAVIPNPENNYQDLWVEVKRGEDYYIEWLDMGLSLDEKEYFFVDSGLSLTRNFKEGFEEKIKETSGALANTEVVVSVQGGYRDVYKPDGEQTREFTVLGKKEHNHKPYCYVSWLIDGDKTYNFELSEDLIGFNIEVNHFYNKDGERVAEEIIKGVYNSTLLNFSVEYKGGNDSVQITIVQEINKDDVNITGLEHLEGRDVKIMVNDCELSNQVVVNGSVKVPYYATKITVGLPIESVYIPQTLYLQTNQSSGIGDVQRIDHLTIMLWKSMGGKIGEDMNCLVPIYFRDTDSNMNLPTPLYTGNKKIVASFNTSTVKEKGSTLVIFNDSVYPMNILAIAPHFSTSGGGV